MLCPSESQLILFLEADAEDQLPSDLLAHLEHCADCHGRLEKLTDHHALRACLTQYDGSEGQTPPGDPTTNETGSVLDGPLLEQTREKYERLLERARRDADDEHEQFEQLVSDSWSDSSPSRYGHPKRFGRFRLKRFLGKGGFGVVYLARDELLERYVALKLPLAPTFADPSVRRRFMHEGQAAGQLHHPNIVAIYEAGEIDEICYLSSAYCSGPNLARWLEQHGEPIPPQVAAQIMVSLADAVQHAHDRNILHRDIKPANVLLEPTVSSEKMGRRQTLPYVPKLSDFGLAKSVEDRSANTTSSRVIVGTARYLSPEQAGGRADQVGPQSDIYSLGAVLYELLTNQPAIEGDNNAVTLTKVIGSEPRRPRAIVPEVPRDLEAICLKCLEKSPQDRYASAEALSHDLRRFLAGESTLARPLSMVARLGKWSRRNPAWAALATTILVSLAALGALGWWSNAALTKSLERSQTLLYAADVRLAAESVQRFNTRRSRELLTRHIPAEGEPDRRGFVWHYLWQAINSEQRALKTEPQESAWCVSVTQSNDWIAAGDAAGRVWLWDAQSQSPSVTFQAHEDTIRSIEFSPGGMTLLTSSDDETVRLWDASSRTLRFEIDEHSDVVYRARFTRDGRFFATCAGDGLVRMWRSHDGSLWKEFDGHTDRVYDLAFSRDGRFLVTTGKDCRAIMWDTASAEPIAEFTDQAHQWGRFECVDVTPDGSLVAVGTNEGHVVIWDTQSKKQVALYSDHTSNVLRVRFSSNGESIASASKDTTIRVRQALNGTNLRVLQGHDQPVYDVQFESDDSHLVSSGKDGSVRIWDVSTSAYERMVVHGSPTYAMSRSRQRVALTRPGPRIVLRDTVDSSKHVVPADNDKWRVDHQLSGNGRYLAVVGEAFGASNAIDEVMAQRSTVHVEDVDGDGDLDWVSALPSSRQLVWQECGSDGQFAPPRLVVVEGELLASTSHRTTMIRDAGGQTVRLRLSRNRVRAFPKHDTATPCHPRTLLSDLNEPSCIAVADVDGDGDDDVIIATENDRTLAWWENAGNLELVRQHVIARDVQDVLHVVARRMGGTTLIVAVVENGRSVVKFQAAPSGPHALWNATARRTESVVSLVDVADVNGDGKTDLVVASRDGILADCTWLVEPNSPWLVMSSLKDAPWLVRPPANVLLYDLHHDTPRLMLALNAMTNDTYEVALSDDGAMMATVSSGEIIRLWDTASGRLVRTFPHVEVTNTFSGIAFADQGRALVFSAGDSGFIWNLQRDELQPRVLHGHSNTINDLEVSPDQRYVATTSHDHTVRIWDLESNRNLQTLVGHQQRPVKVCFAPNGKLLASVGEFGEVLIWHLRTGQELLALSNFDCSSVSGLGFFDNDSLFVLGEHLDEQGRRETHLGLWKSHPLQLRKPWDANGS